MVIKSCLCLTILSSYSTLRANVSFFLLCLSAAVVYARNLKPFLLRLALFFSVVAPPVPCRRGGGGGGSLDQRVERVVGCDG